MFTVWGFPSILLLLVYDYNTFPSDIMTSPPAAVANLNLSLLSLLFPLQYSIAAVSALVSDDLLLFSVYYFFYILLLNLCGNNNLSFSLVDFHFSSVSH